MPKQGLSLGGVPRFSLNVFLQKRTSCKPRGKEQPFPMSGPQRETFVSIRATYDKSTCDGLSVVPLRQIRPIL